MLKITIHNFCVVLQFVFNHNCLFLWKPCKIYEKKQEK